MFPTVLIASYFTSVTIKLRDIQGHEMLFLRRMIWFARFWTEGPSVTVRINIILETSHNL